MLSMQAVAEALMDTHATVASVALTIGRLGEKRTSEYRVDADNPALLAVSIGVPDGQDTAAAPQYVQFYFSPDYQVSLAQLVPNCNHWKKRPNNPGASPFFYVCRFDGSKPDLEVDFVVTLTGDIASPSSHIKKLLLQRSVWR